MKKIALFSQKMYFSERWLEYCIAKNIPYKLVDFYSNDIIDQLSDCYAVMWHVDHMSFKDSLFAKQLIHSIELSGKKVFPDIRTIWHFDDKLGQKYLLEAIGAPLVKSYIFYSRTEAIKWVKMASFPKVFKLRGGSGSLNVNLVKSKGDAIKLINKCFRTGFSAYNATFVFKERLRLYLMGKAKIESVLKWFLAIFFGSWVTKLYNREIGYAYFQDFIPNNTFDIRIVVVGDRAFGLKRLVRKDDFRASGSGFIIYAKEQIPVEAVKIAFETNSKLKAQSMAYDFVFDESNNPYIVEVSFGYNVAAYDKCEGYWDSELNWIPGSFIPQNWMVDDILAD